MKCRFSITITAITLLTDKTLVNRKVHCFVGVFYGKKMSPYHDKLSRFSCFLFLYSHLHCCVIESMQVSHLPTLTYSWHYIHLATRGLHGQQGPGLHQGLLQPLNAKGIHEPWSDPTQNSSGDQTGDLWQRAWSPWWPHFALGDLQPSSP